MLLAGPTWMSGREVEGPGHRRRARAGGPPGDPSAPPGGPPVAGPAAASARSGCRLPAAPAAAPWATRRYARKCILRWGQVRHLSASSISAVLARISTSVRFLVVLVDGFPQRARGSWAGYIRSSEQGSAIRGTPGPGSGTPRCHRSPRTERPCRCRRGGIAVHDLNRFLPYQGLDAGRSL